MLVRKPADIDSATAAADMVTRTHEQLVEYLGPGRTLLEVDRQVQVILESLGCASAFKGYRVRGHPPFPNQACLSVNDCIVHGTHDSLERPLEVSPSHNALSGRVLLAERQLEFFKRAHGCGTAEA